MSDFVTIAEWNIQPDSGLTSELAAQYEAALEQCETPMKASMNLCIVFDEIYSNICNYSGATELVINISKADSIIKVTFRDNGIQFDPTKVGEVDITRSAEERQIGGLGIHMVRKMTNTMDYEYVDGWNYLIMTKICEQ